MGIDIGAVIVWWVKQSVDEKVGYVLAFTDEE